MTDNTDLIERLGEAERASGMTLAEAQAYVANRLHAWRRNIPDRIPKEIRAARVLASALRASAKEMEGLKRDLTDAAALLQMVVVADEENRPNGVMDCIDNDGLPYQSSTMAGIVTHAQGLLLARATLDAADRSEG